MGITLDMATTTSAGGGPFYVKYTASGSHLLQIDGYSITKHAPNGTSLKSCPFTVGGYRWMLHLFPNGDRPESSGFISIFICLYKCFERRRVSLQVELSFIDEVDKQNRAHVRTRQVLELYGNYGVGYRRFIAREALENSKYLNSDCFTVRCDFIITGYVNVNVDIPENGHGRTRKCTGCNLRPVKVVELPLIHACFCDVCSDASHNDPTAKRCTACHGPYEGRILLL
jgi:hypothetical protein